MHPEFESHPDLGRLAQTGDGALLGWAALEDVYGLRPVQPMTTTSRVGKTRKQASRDGYTVHTWPAVYAPSGDIRGHFEFGLKYDELNLEWLARFFPAAGPAWIEEWLTQSPTSVYARRTACLYEWFTGERLNSPDTAATNYELLVSPDEYLAAVAPQRNRRWKIDNNLPGTPRYCPLVRWTPELAAVASVDIRGDLDALSDRFDAGILSRAAARLTFAESRATFAIEREADRTTDIQRFANALAVHCGKLEEPLSEDGLRVLQREVLGARALRVGIRRSPVFVGSAAHHDATIVKYIAPPHQRVGELLDGLRFFEQSTRGRSALVRAAALSFGFVYVHPLADGNGRVHRFLLNDVLLRDGVVPPGIILPISATILQPRFFGEYDRVLDSISHRQVVRYTGCWRFVAEPVDDGVVTDFVFDDDEDCRPLWAYPDLTHHAEFACRVLAHTVRHSMSEEATFLARHDRAMQRVKAVYEMPDRDAERIIRSLRGEAFRVSNKLAAQYPTLFDDPQVAAELIEAVQSAFEDREMDDVDPGAGESDRSGEGRGPGERP